MKKIIYEYSDYKRYVNDWIRGRPGRGHGAKAEIAAALKIQRAYVSQVLKGDAHISLEQGERLNHYLGHSKDEARYFLMLLQYTRAGTRALRDFFLEELEKMRKQQFDLKHLLQADKAELPPESQAIYYSSWYYLAVRMVLNVPGIDTKEAIAKRLSLPLEVTAETLQLLVRMGLVEQKGDHYCRGPVLVHLEKESPHLLSHHTNWRLQAVASLERRCVTDRHFSGVMNLSRKDAEKIRLLLIQEIKKIKEIVVPSKEECTYVFCSDFFEL